MAKKKSKGGWSFFGKKKNKAQDDDAALGISSDDNDSRDDDDIYDKPKPTAPPPETNESKPSADPESQTNPDKRFMETNKPANDSDADPAVSGLDSLSSRKPDSKPMKKKKSRFGSFFGLGKKKEKRSKADSWEFDSDDDSSDSDDGDEEQIKKRLAHMNNANANTNTDPNVKTDFFGHPIVDDSSASASAVSNASTVSSSKRNNRNTVERNKHMKKGVSFRKSVQNLLGKSNKGRGRSTAFNDLMNEDATPPIDDEDLKAQQDESWMVDVGGDRGKINTYFVEDDPDDESDEDKEKKQEVKNKPAASDSEISLDASENNDSETEPEETDYSDAEKLETTGYDSDVLEIGNKPKKKSKLKSFLAGLEEEKEKEEEEEDEDEDENNKNVVVPVSRPGRKKIGIANFLEQSSSNNKEPEMEPVETVVGRILPENEIPSPIVKKQKPDFAVKNNNRSESDRIKTKGAYEDFEEASLTGSDLGVDDEIGKNKDFEYSTFETYKKSSDGESSSKKEKKRRRRKIKKKKKRKSSNIHSRGHIGRERRSGHSEFTRTNAPAWDPTSVDFDVSDTDDDDFKEDYELAQKALGKSVEKDANMGEIEILKVEDEVQRNKEREEKKRIEAEEKQKEENRSRTRQKALEVDHAVMEQLKNERDELLQLKSELEMEHEKEDNMGKMKEMERNIRLELKKEKEEMAKLKKELKRKRREEKRRQEEELERLEEERIEDEKRQLEETRQMIAELEEERRLLEEEEEMKRSFELKERKRVEGLRKKKRKRSKKIRKEYSLIGLQDMIFDLEDKFITPQFESGVKALVVVVCVSTLFRFIAYLVGIDALSFGIVKPRNAKSLTSIVLSSFIHNDTNTFIRNMFSLIQLGGVFLLTDKEPANLRDILMLSAVISGSFAFFLSVKAGPMYGSSGLVTGLFSHLLFRGFLDPRPLYQAVAWAMAVFLVFGIDSVVGKGIGEQALGKGIDEQALDKGIDELALGGCVAGIATSLLSSTLSNSLTASYYSSLLIDY